MFFAFVLTICSLSMVKGQTCAAKAYLNNNCGGIIEIDYSFTTNNVCTAPTGFAQCYYEADCDGSVIVVRVYNDQGCDGSARITRFNQNTNECQTFVGCQNAYVKMQSTGCCPMDNTPRNFTKVIDDFEEYITKKDNPNHDIVL
eukprot:416909_1